MVTSKRAKPHGSAEVVNEDVFAFSGHVPMELTADAAEGIRRLNDAGCLVIFVTDQSMVARGECAPDVLRFTDNKMETVLGRERAWIDALRLGRHQQTKGLQDGDTPRR
jgi:mannose-1-phosphate guanylyltransferase/phosphomannomutase